MPEGPGIPHRCAWVTARGTSELDVRYHDEEWGVPTRDDRALFEMLCLEGAQAGLSWSVILKKREGYRRAFEGFEIDRVARMDGRRIERLVADPSIVRHRRKIESVIANARAAVREIEQWGSLQACLWRFVGGEPVVNRWSSPDQMPASTPASTEMSRSLKSAGFSFVGPTICYAFMQATGMVNDHTTDCFRHPAFTE